MTDQPDISFGLLLRQLRAKVKLTQEELAEAAGVSPRSVSDLERGINRTAQKSTALLLAGALGLTGQPRALFVAAARGRASACEVLAAQQVAVSAAGVLPVGLAIPQVRYSLPADAVAFTGRGRELNRIIALGAARTGGVVVVGAIDGMPGVGKTALAVHAAHLLREEFPDRQLFVDLHAHAPGREPMRPQDALAGLLAAVGVDPRYLPDDLAGRAALWRDQMAGQQALLVFDNAADSGQVAPLLPGGGGCLVLVTSRRHLGDLPGAVTPVLVDVLPPEQAAEMFTRLVPRAASDRGGVAELVALAGYLPLAVRLLARVLARHPSWTLADLITEFRAGILAIAAENENIAAAFEVSYRYLNPGSQQLFHLLGVNPGTTIDGYAAAALAGIGHAEAARLLDGLHREGLLAESGYRRYGMHDLIRRYAFDLATADNSATEYQQALNRLLDFYQHAAVLAASRLARQTRPGSAPTALARFEVPCLEDTGQALAWARAHRGSLLACLDLVTRTGQHARVVALTAGLAAALRRDGPWAEAITRHAAAADAARHARDRLGEANALTDLADIQHLSGDPGAAATIEEALAIYHDLGDDLGKANTLHNLGEMRHAMGYYPDAAEAFEEALRIYHDVGDRLGEANACFRLGTVRELTGDYPDAARVLEKALDLYRDLGNQNGEANTLHELGILRQWTGDYLRATRVLDEALGIYRDLGNQLGEANALHALGMVRQRTGDYAGAAGFLEEALGIYRDLGSRLGEANTLHDLGINWQRTGKYAGAAGFLEEALGIYRGLGSRIGEANALRELGVVRRRTGDYAGAAEVLEVTLGICRDLGDRQAQAETLNEQGILHRLCGDLTQAQQCHQHALALARAIGSSRDDACALAGLARCALARSDTAPAETLLRQAHQAFQRICAPETQELLAELQALTQRRPTPPGSAS